MLPLLGVGFFARHQKIGDLGTSLDVQNHYARTQTHTIVRDLGHIDHREVRQAFLQLTQAGVELTLPLLGGVILGILAQVAMRAGLQDLPWQLVAQFILQRVDFFLQFFINIQH